MHYRGGAPVLWRSPDTIQVGSSRGTVVCGLSAREQRFLSSLPEFISPESVRADARAGSGASGEEPEGAEESEESMVRSVRGRGWRRHRFCPGRPLRVA